MLMRQLRNDGFAAAIFNGHCSAEQRAVLSDGARIVVESNRRETACHRLTVFWTNSRSISNQVTTQDRITRDPVNIVHALPRLGGVGNPDRNERFIQRLVTIVSSQSYSVGLFMLHSTSGLPHNLYPRDEGPCSTPSHRIDHRARYFQCSQYTHH
jgi:hypothetical protein